MEELPDGSIAFVPREPSAGLIFYPGGKVEHTAYAPLCRALACRGILCVLVRMPLRLAVFDVSAADGLEALYPEVPVWYIGGHSLGGSMAAVYALRHTSCFRGLALLASYSTADLSSSGLKVITIYGSEDGVLNMDKLAKFSVNLPASAQTVVIDGGCHALFGSYGAQKGDGTPLITGQEQVERTVDALTQWMNG